jgi:hypothetical protein
VIEPLNQVIGMKAVAICGHRHDWIITDN